MTSTRKSTYLAVTFFLAAAAAAIFTMQPQRVDGASGPEVRNTPTFSPDSVRTGEHTVLSVRTEIPSGYHFYSMTKVEDGPTALKLTVEDPALEPAGDWYGPTPSVEYDEGFEKHVEYFSGEVTHKRAFKILSAPIDGKVLLKLKGQICNENQCIPVRDKLEITLTHQGGEARAEHVSVPTIEGEVFNEDRQAPTEATAQGGTNPKEEGLLLFILAAIGFGFLSLATPCVFPMIPITISFFSKFTEISTRRTVTMAGIYMFSIIAVFTVIGLILTAIFGGDAMQEVSTQPVFNVFMVALLAVFAFNLFGLFEIRMPNWLISRTAQKEQELSTADGSLGRQAAGVFFMAVTFTLVSFTCTVGFLGMVLAMAVQGEWFYSTVGMIGFSFGFAFPFFFLALFPKLASKLQGKGGDWMVAVKVTLGFLEAAFAFKFLSNLDLNYQWGIVTRPAVLAVWGVLAALAGLYLLRVFALPHNDTSVKHVGPLRMAVAIVLLVFSAHFFYGMTHQKPVGGWIDGWLPPAVYPGQEADVEGDEGVHLSWIKDDMDKGFEVAKKEKKPLFIDFTGFQCTNCRQMESSYFPRPAIRSRLEKMVRVQAYTDGPKDVHDKQRDYQMERFGTAALPVYVILDPFEDKLLAKFESLASSEEEYVAFLDKGLKAFERVLEKHKGQAEESKTSADDQETAAAHDGDAGASDEPEVSISPAGDPLDFEYPDLKTGKAFKLSSLRGNWVLVNLWASWCKPCRKELKEDFPPALEGAPHIKMVTIAFEDEDTRESAVEFANQVNLWKHVALMGPDDVEESGLPDAFAADNSLPYSYLIDPEGRLAWRVKGAVHKETLVKLFAQAKPRKAE